MTTWVLEEAEGPSLSDWASISEASLCLRSSYSVWLKPGVTSPEEQRSHMWCFSVEQHLMPTLTLCTTIRLVDVFLFLYVTWSVEWRLYVLTVRALSYLWFIIAPALQYSPCLMRCGWVKGLGWPRYRGGTVFGFKPPGFTEMFLHGHQTHPADSNTTQGSSQYPSSTPLSLITWPRN